MDEKQLQALYKAMQSKLDLGDYNSFESNLINNDKFRKAFHSEASKDLEIGDLNNFTNDLKKKETTSQDLSNGSNAYGLPSAPTTLSDEQDPISLAQQADQLSRQTKEGSEINSAGLPNQIPDQEAIDKANKIKADLKVQGHNADQLVNEYKDFPQEAFDAKDKNGNPIYTKQQLLDLKKSNPLNYVSKLNSIKNLYDIKNSPTGGIDAANQFNGLHEHTDLNNLYSNVQQQQDIIGKTLTGDQRDKALERLKESNAHFISPTDPDLLKAYQSSPLKEIVDPAQFAGLETQRVFEPEKYQKTLQMLQAPDKEGSIANDAMYGIYGNSKNLADYNNKQLGQEIIKQQLANSGRDNATSTAQNELTKISKALETTTDPQHKQDLIKMYKGWQGVLDNITADKQKDASKYPLSNELNLDEQMKEKAQQATLNPAEYGMYRFGKGLENTVNTIQNVGTSLFGGDADNAALQAQRLGELRSDQNTEFLPSSISKNDNLFSKGTLYKTVGTLGDIASIAAQSALLGAGGANNIVSASLPMYSTAQNDYYKQAIAEGRSNPSEYANTHAMIMALAGMVNPDLNIVKRSFGAETAIGKELAGISESTWNNVIKNNPPLLEKFKNSVISSGQEAAKIAGVYGLGTSVASDVADNALFDGKNSMSDIIDHGVKQAKDQVVAMLPLIGMNAITHFKSVSPEQKAMIWEAGSTPKNSIADITEAIDKGEISKEEGNKKIDEVNKISSEINKVPIEKADGSPMTEKDRVDYLYNSIIKEKANKLKNDLPQVHKDTLSNAAKEADELNGDIISNTSLTDNISIGDTLDKQVSYKGDKGLLSKEGLTVIFTPDNSNKIYELGNFDSIKDSPISDYNIRHEQSVVSVHPSGSLIVRGKEYLNKYSDPLKAINYNKDGNIISVNLETQDGKKRTFKKNIAEDLAYQIHLKELNKDDGTTEKFEQFINKPEVAKEINSTRFPTTTESKPIEDDERISREKIEPSRQFIDDSAIRNERLAKIKELADKHFNVEQNTNDSEKNSFDQKDALDIKRTPVAELNTDARFQGREKLNDDKVKEIAENWNDKDQDPIHIWTNPTDNKTYVLSGHHRLEAAKHAGIDNVKTIDRSDLSNADAVKFATEDANANRTMENPLERANTLRKKRERGDSKDDIHEFLNREGKNKIQVENLSYLNPKGSVIEALKSLDKNTDVDTQNRINKVADWVGEARKRLPTLSDAHEKEMFDFLLNEDVSKRIKTKSDFLSKLNSITGTLDFDNSKPLNLNRFKYQSEGEKIFDNRTNELKQEIQNRQDKINDILSRFKDPKNKDYISVDASDYSSLKAAADSSTANLNHELKAFQKQLQEHYQERGKYQADNPQQSLFEPDSKYKQLSLNLDHETEIEGEKVQYRSASNADYPSEVPLQENKDQNTVKAVWNKLKDLQFSGKVKVKNHADVAHIMRLLESKSIEHGFAVHIDKKGNSHIQLLSLGGITGTVIDPRHVLAGVKQFESQKVYLIHNHPSGNLTPSQADLALSEKIFKGLKELGVEGEHLIMDTFKAKYTRIANDLGVEQYSREESNNDKKLIVHHLDGQEILSSPISDRISSSLDSAKVIQALQYSALPKRAMLVLSQANEVIANHFLKDYKLKEVTDKFALSPTATSIIFYGNEDAFNKVNNIKSKLSKFDAKVLDFVRVAPSNDITESYVSAADEGLLHEVQEKYGTNLLKEVDHSPIDKFIEEAKSAIPDISAKELYSELKNRLPGISLTDIENKLNGNNDQKKLSNPTETSIQGVKITAPSPSDLSSDGTLDKYYTSLKNSISNAESAKLNLDPIIKDAAREWSDVWNKAEEEFNKNPQVGDDLVNKFLKERFALTDLQGAILERHKIIVNKAANKVRNETLALYDKKEITPEESALIKSNEVLQKMYMDKLSDIYNVIDKGGTETARGLAFRKLIIDDDFNIVNLENKTREAVGNRLLSTQEKAFVNQVHSEYQKAQSEVEQKTESLTDRINKANENVALKKLQDEMLIRFRKDKKNASKEVIFKEREQLKKSIQDKWKQFSRGQLNAGIPLPVEMIPDIINLAKGFIKEGFIDAKDKIQDIAHLTDKVFDTLNLEGLSKRDIRDAITSYGKMRSLSQDEVDVKFREVKREGRLVSALEDVIKGKAPAKSGLELDKPTDKERELKRQIDRLMRENNIQVVDPQKEQKTALDRIKTRLQNDIADLDVQIERGRKDPTKEKTAPLMDSKEISDLRAEKERKTDILNSITGGETALSDAQQIERASAYIRKSIENYKKLIADKSERQKNISKLPESKELDALKAERDQLAKDYKAMLDAEGITYKRKLEAYKKNIDARTKVWESKIERVKNGEDPKNIFNEIKKPQPLRPDQQLIDARKKLNNVVRKFQKDLLEKQLSQRSKSDKILDGISDYTRNAKLTRVSSIAKLMAAAGYRAAFSVPEDHILGNIGAITPGLKYINDRAAGEGSNFNRIAAKTAKDYVAEMYGNNGWALGNILKGNIGQGFKDAKELLHLRRSKFDEMAEQLKDRAGRVQLDPTWKEYYAQIHSAVKSPIKWLFFRKSLEKRVAWCITNGIDYTDPLVNMQNQILAMKDGKRAIFQQDNKLTDIFNDVIRKLETSKEHQTTNKILATLLHVLIPFAKIPTNIAGEVATYSGGLPAGLFKTGKTIIKDNASIRGLMKEGLSREEATNKFNQVDEIKFTSEDYQRRMKEMDSIYRTLKKGGVGSAMMAIGYIYASSIGGYYQDHEHRKDGDVKAGNMRIGDMDIPRFLLHNPAMEMLQLGATIRRVIDKHIAKHESLSKATAHAAIASALGITEGLPFMNLTSLKNLFDPSSPKFDKFIADFLKDNIVPGGIQEIANRENDIQDRKPNPHGIAERFAASVPGFTELVPEKQKHAHLRTSYSP